MPPFTNMGKTSPSEPLNLTYYGSVGDSLSEGHAVCFPRSYVSAKAGELTTDYTARRINTVAKPDNTNNRAFAGVLEVSQTLSIQPVAFARVFAPGSVCQVYLTEANSTLDAVATFIAGGANAGKFTTSVKALGGRGCARLLQTTSGAGLCWAELLDGEESGGVEFITPAAAGGAITPMVGGITVFPTAVTLAANATFTLAAGDREGLRKVFLCKAAMTTNDIVMTVTNGLQIGAATALATVSFDADGEYISLVYRIGKWLEELTVGAAKAAS